MSKDLSHLSFPTPIGPLTIFSENDALIVIESGRVTDGEENDPLLNEAKDQINAYFDGKLTTFDLPLAPDGPPRRRALWMAMMDIGYGETCSYGDFAKRVKSSPRAIGGGCAHNPIPIIIPCHRILAANRKMGGYSFANGAETKEQLLILEGAIKTQS